LPEPVSVRYYEDPFLPPEDPPSPRVFFWKGVAAGGLGLCGLFCIVVFGPLLTAWSLGLSPLWHMPFGPTQTLPPVGGPWVPPVPQAPTPLVPQAPPAPAPEDPPTPPPDASFLLAPTSFVPSPPPFSTTVGLSRAVYPALGLHAHTALVAHLRTQWRVPPDLIEGILVGVEKAHRAHRLSPELLLAVMAVESSFRMAGNPGTNKKDPQKPHGLMQIYGKWHAEKFPQKTPVVLPPVEHILVGSLVLREYMDREKGNTVRALQRYNGALHDGTQKYARKVLTHKKHFAALLSGAQKS
jgi:hypothetical protein